MKQAGEEGEGEVRGDIAGEEDDGVRRARRRSDLHLHKACTFFPSSLSFSRLNAGIGQSTIMQSPSKISDASGSTPPVTYDLPMANSFVAAVHNRPACCSPVSPSPSGDTGGDARRRLYSLPRFLPASPPPEQPAKPVGR
uniref:Uncharacterized protein n=1 Tax=Leersia perrieri TaxID=77586 RepID=A0A0D9WL23_9ORYZ